MLRDIKQLLSQKVTKCQFLTTLINRSCLIQKEHYRTQYQSVLSHALGGHMDLGTN